MCALIFSLPADSALAHATGEWWSIENELAAVTLEVLFVSWMQLRALGGDTSVKHVKPLKVKRPGIKQTTEARKPVTDHNQIERFFAKG